MLYRSKTAFVLCPVRVRTILFETVTRGERTNRSFYSDQIGVIRYTKEDRPATVDDNPLGFDWREGIFPRSSHFWSSIPGIPGYFNSLV